MYWLTIYYVDLVCSVGISWAENRFDVIRCDLTAVP